MLVGSVRMRLGGAIWGRSMHCGNQPKKGLETQTKTWAWGKENLGMLLSLSLSLSLSGPC